MNIFIVDDSAVIRKRLHFMLSDVEGARVVGHANTVTGALKEIKERKPDTVILDIRLPDGSGIDILRSLEKNGTLSTCSAQEDGDGASPGSASREKRSHYRPLIIVLTNFPYPRYRQICLEGGANYFFDKSAEFDRVIDVIIDRMRNREENRPHEE